MNEKCDCNSLLHPKLKRIKECKKEKARRRGRRKLGQDGYSNKNILNE